MEVVEVDLEKEAKEEEEEDLERLRNLTSLLV